MTTSSSVSPTQAVLHVIAGFWLSRCVYIAAKLGLADLLDDGPKTPAELAGGVDDERRAVSGGAQPQHRQQHLVLPAPPRPRRVDVQREHSDRGGSSRV